MIERKVTLDLQVTPEELAFEFSNFNNEDQVKFFNALHEITRKWSTPLCIQLQFITENQALTDGARFVMRQIGEYSSRYCDKAT